MRKKGINPIFSVNFGLPNETLVNAYETIEFILRLKAVSNISVCYTTCFPNSPIFEDSQNYQVEKEPSPTNFPCRTIYGKYDMRQVFAQLYRSNITRKTIDSLKHKQCLDYRLIFTGLFNEYKTNNTFDAIFVDKMNDENLKFIDKCIKIDGDVFFHNSNLVMGKKTFADDRKQLKVIIPVFDENMYNAHKKNCLLPNQNFYYSNKNKIILQRNNIYNEKPMIINMRNFDIEEDFNYFEDAFSVFKENNTINIESVKKIGFMNSCAYAGKCFFCNLNKVRIDGTLVYASCNDIVLGEVKMDYNEIRKNALKIKKEYILKRKCAICSVNKWCPKCISPYHIWNNDKDYCRYMQRDKDFLIFLKIIGKIYTMFQENDFFKELNIHAYFLYKQILDLSHN